MTEVDIATAILALEAYASAARPKQGDVLRDGCDLAVQAWTSVCGGGCDENSLRSDALEAAAMLRDGYLPGGSGWEHWIHYKAVL